MAFGDLVEEFDDGLVGCTCVRATAREPAADVGALEGGRGADFAGERALAEGAPGGERPVGFGVASSRPKPLLTPVMSQFLVVMSLSFPGCGRDLVADVEVHPGYLSLSCGTRRTVT